jgi:hypothetical protein
MCPLCVRIHVFGGVLYICKRCKHAVPHCKHGMQTDFCLHANSAGRAMTPPNDRTRAYDWRCDRCRAVNVESDVVCWYCNAAFLDGSTPVDDDVFVPKSAWRNEDVIAEVAAEIVAVYSGRGLTAVRRTIARLSEAYGEYLVKANRRPKQRTGRLWRWSAQPWVLTRTFLLDGSRAIAACT